MAFAGTTTVTKEDDKGIKIVSVGYDANGEESGVIDLTKYGTFRLWTLSIHRTVGAAAPTISLQGTVDENIFEDIISITAADDIDYAVNKPFNKIRIYCTTVGAGNTLTARIIGVK